MRYFAFELVLDEIICSVRLNLVHCRELNGVLTGARSYNLGRSFIKELVSKISSTL